MNTKLKIITVVGARPQFIKAAAVSRAISSQFSNQVEEIYYYGAGCAAPEKKVEVEQALRSIFPIAQIQIDHDLLAAAKATCGHRAGIACILGTGSNSCDYDGKTIVASRPAAGYILGDEGGGIRVYNPDLSDLTFTVIDNPNPTVVLARRGLYRLFLRWRPYLRVFLVFA